MAEQKIEVVRNERTDWLRTLADGWRTEIPPVFAVTLDGYRWIGSTNGLAMTLLRAEDGEDAHAPVFAPADALAEQSRVLDWRPLPAGFDAWVLRYDRRCGNCGGLGFVALLGYAAFDKNGNGPRHNLWAKCVCDRPGKLLGVPLNRKLLMEFLGPLTVTEAAGKGSMVALRGIDCLVIAMGLATKPGEPPAAGGEWDEFPAPDQGPTRAADGEGE